MSDNGWEQPNASTATSRSLLAGLQADDPAAWERLVRLYTPLIAYWCRRLDLPEQDLPDVAQEIFQSLAVHVERFRKDRPGDTFRGWLRTVTRNKVYDHFRRQKREVAAAAGGTAAQIRLAQTPFAPLGDDADADEQRAHDALLARALELVRPHFAEQTWQAFWRVVVLGRTPHEVAAELDMRPGTIRVAKSRVLQRLRSELGDVAD